MMTVCEADTCQQQSTPSLTLEEERAVVTPEKMYLDESVCSQTSPVSTRHATIANALNQCQLLSADGERALFRQLTFFNTRLRAVESTVETSRKPKQTQREIDQLTEQARMVRDQIAVANLRLVASIASRVANGEEQFDEFFGEATSILLYAIDKYDYTRGFRFSTYATHAVQRHLYRLVKRQTRRGVHEFASDQQALTEHPDVAPDTPEFRDEQSSAQLQEILSRIDQILDEREQQIVLGRFGLDGSNQQKTFQVLGEQFGLSKERARQLFNRGLNKLGQAVQPLEDDLP